MEKSILRNSDIPIPLFPSLQKKSDFAIEEKASEIRNRSRLPSDQRKYMAVFKGGRPGTFAQVRTKLLDLDSETRGYVVATYCCLPSWCRTLPHRRHSYSCEIEASYADSFNFTDLILDSRFGFVPRGMGVHSYRLSEIMAAGAIPIILADGFVKPFDINKMMDWNAFSFTIPEKKVSTIPGLLSSLPMDKILKMQAKVIEVFEEYFDSREHVIKFCFHILAKKFSEVDALWDLTLAEKSFINYDLTFLV